jgi:adenylate kinase family enzyme
MRRVLVIGSGGSGKSTLAARLARLTGLPLVQLDALYWKAGWVAPEQEEWLRIVDGILDQECWLIDGNYSGTLDRRLDACDTVIFLDRPRLLCLARVLWRRIKYHGRSRPGVAAGCVEQISPEFLAWIWTYPSRRKPKVLARLAALRPEQTAIVLATQREIEAFLQGVSRS